MRKPLPLPRLSGFTLFEVLLAVVLTMILMFGALYSTSESFEVVREGDRRIHTHIHARRSLDRLLKDCRYSSALEIDGDAASGWEITVDTTGSLDPGTLVYTWSPQTRILKVADGTLEDIVIQGLKGFQLKSTTVQTAKGTKVARITATWTLDVNAGLEAGKGAKAYTMTLSGSTWIRENVPEF
ncbi:MAG: hypothetical protein ACE5H3_06560 [Planctomycetota bacterium]